MASRIARSWIARMLIIGTYILAFPTFSHSFSTGIVKQTSTRSCRDERNANPSSIPSLSNGASKRFLSSNFEFHPKNRRRVTSLNMGLSTPAAVVTSLHSNNNFIISVLSVLAACGISMEKNTKVGKAISANLVTMLLALLLANVGVIPFSSPVYGIINKIFVPLAVPLFLFDSDLKRVISDAGSLLAAFFVGAISTIIGTLGSFALVPMKSLGDEGWKVASALAARHIGGAINFVAVADTLNIDGGVVGAAIAADNVIVALYFAFLFYLATPGSSIGPNTTLQNNDNKLDEEIDIPGETKPCPITASTIAYSMATASCLVTVGSMLTKIICPSISSMVLTSLLTVVSATSLPNWFMKLRSTGLAIGILFLQLFFAASGASGSLVLVLRQAPSLIAFCTLQLGIHFGVLVTIGKVMFNMNSNELYLASNANVGGPTTAAAMAQAKEWPRLVLPAILVGVFGYATATAAALSLQPILIKLAAR